jgi:hypothetical protein
MSSIRYCSALKIWQQGNFRISMLKNRILLSIVFTLSISICPVSALTVAPVGTPGPDGWTEFSPSVDTRIVYVSSSDGNDSNDGLTEFSPVRTLVKGKSLVRWGFPDWMLLKKGDTWVSESIGSWGISGRSPGEPSLLSSYGVGERPTIAYPDGTGLSYNGSTTQHDIAIVGIRFALASNPPKESIRWLGSVTNLLIEDCLMECPVIFQAARFGEIKNIALRRSLILDAFNPVKCQGLFIQRTSGILLEENVFDNNGYLDQSGTIGGSLIVNHNVYVQKDCEDFTAKGNISMRAPSHGLQARVGGLVDNNLFINDAMALVVGNGKGVSKVINNVVLDGKDIPRSGATTLYRAWGIELTDVHAENGALVEGNIIAYENSGQPFPIGMFLSNNVHNALLTKNIVYGWRRPFQLNSFPGTNLTEIGVVNNIFQTVDTDREILEVRHSLNLPLFINFSGNVYFGTAQPQSKWFFVDAANYLDPAAWQGFSGETDARMEQAQFVDSTRTILTYQTSLGYPATFQSFIEEVRKQSKDTWRPEFSAPVINDYFRAGFTPLNEWTPSGDITPPFPGVILAVTQIDDTIQIQYTGAQDELGGSGLKEVRLWRRIDSGPWEATRRARFGATALAGTITYEEMGDSATYSFALRATDFAGNTSEVPAPDFFPLTANVVYAAPPSTEPVITLLGPDPFAVGKGGIFTDPGAIATDAEDGDITPFMLVDGSDVNTQIPGDYVVKYNVEDSSGIPAHEAQRTVSVFDVAVPPDDAPISATTWLAMACAIAGAAFWCIRRTRALQ